MTQPLVINLINHAVSTQNIINQFQTSFLREFPELNPSDLRFHEIDNNGQFVLEVHVHDKENFNLEIGVFNNIKVMRQAARYGRFDQRDRKNNYAFFAQTKVAKFLSNGGERLTSQLSKNPLEAVSDLIYNEYVNKDELRPLANHRQLHDDYDYGYDDNRNNNYDKDAKPNNSNSSVLSDAFHRLFG